MWTRQICKRAKMEQVRTIPDTQTGSRESPKELNYSLARGFKFQAISVSKFIRGQGLLFALTFQQLL